MVGNLHTKSGPDQKGVWLPGSQGRELAVWSRGSEAMKAHLHAGMSHCYFPWIVLERRSPCYPLLALMLAMYPCQQAL